MGTVANNFVHVTTEVSSPTFIHYIAGHPDVALQLLEQVNMDINLNL
jgi:hypothetical protein